MRQHKQHDETHGGHNLIKEYICKYDCMKQLIMSDKTLAKALNNNVMYKNNYFKYLGSKYKCF